MTNVDSAVPPKRDRFHFRWVTEILIRPRKTFTQISELAEASWITPLMVLSITALGLVLTTGLERQAALSSGQITYPPGFEYYTPEQQAQYLQASQATSSPIFIFVLPGLSALTKVWLGWLITGGLLHLIITLFGGRGSTVDSLNIVAWSSLPFAIRDLVRIIYTLSTHHLIQNSGLSGFISPGDSSLLIYLQQLLGIIDIYVIWATILIILGVNQSTKIKTSKVVAGVLVTILFVICVQALFGFLSIKLSSLSITRPFFF